MRLRCRAAIAGTLVSFVLAGSAGAADPAPSVVWYRASEECPPGPEFLGKLPGTASRARLADAGDHIDFVVTLVAARGQTVGRLERQTQGGTVAIRELRDVSCERVADALALSLGLALEPGQPAAAPTAGSEPSTPRASAGLPDGAATVEAEPPSPSPLPTPAATRSVAPQLSAPVAPPVADAERSSAAAPSTPRWSTGPEGGAIFGVAPSALARGAAFVDVDDALPGLAYIYVDGAAPIGSPVHFQLLRVSLSEGEPQLVMDETRPETFASAGDLALWSRAGDGVYQMTSEATAVASVFPASPPLLDLDSYPQLVADATTLFFNGSGVSGVPLAGGTPVSLGLADIPFALYRDFLYGLQAHADVNDVSADTPRGAVLAQAPRKGGAWQSVRALGSGVPFELKIVGDRYFAASFGLNPVATTAPDFCHVRVVTASLGSSAPPILLLDTLLYPPFCPPEYRNFLWAVNASALYWSNDGEAIYSRSLADLP